MGTLNVSLIINDAKTKLTRLGMVLFYSYSLLTVVCCLGVIYGVIDLVLKFAHLNSLFNTSFWEIIALIVSSWFMAKLFLREAFSLIGRDIFQKIKKYDNTEEQEQPSHSKVIPFVKRSNRQ